MCFKRLGLSFSYLSIKSLNLSIIALCGFDLIVTFSNCISLSFFEGCSFLTCSNMYLLCFPLNGQKSHWVISPSWTDFTWLCNTYFLLYCLSQYSQSNKILSLWTCWMCFDNSDFKCIPQWGHVSLYPSWITLMLRCKLSSWLYFYHIYCKTIFYHHEQPECVS